MTTEVDSWRAQLVEAEAAYHKLMIGQSTVKLEEGPTAVTYHVADSRKLLGYIESLKRKIAKASGERYSRGSGQAVFCDG